VITAQTPSAETLTDAPQQAAPPPVPPSHAAPQPPPSQPMPTPSAEQPHAPLAPAIDTQAQRVDQLSAAILRATAQLSWSGRAADRFRDRAAERARECLQLAVALRASGDRIYAAAQASEKAR
jgi:small-conductance mechanosensitive channel